MSALYPCQILDRFESLLKPLTLTEERVYRGRIYNKDNTPSISIYMGRSPFTLRGQFIDQSMEIKQLITVTENESNLDKKTLEVFNQSLSVIMADHTLGFNFVKYIEPTGMGEPQILGESSKPIQQTEFAWKVHFRHSLIDMGT